MKKNIAAFDFDGTLTTRDALIPFLRFYWGWVKALQKGALFCREILSAPFYQDRRKLKQGLIKVGFKGIAYTELVEAGERFFDEWVQHHLRQEILDHWRWHQSEGHEIVLVSGNILPILIPFGKRFKADHVLGTQIALDSSGLVLGHFEGENCIGEEKVLRLLEKVGPRSSFNLYAYGNSRGDTALLKTADYPKRV